MYLLGLVGQILIGAVFLIGACFDIMDRQPLHGLLAKKNVPYREYLIPGAIGLKIVCGLMLILNFLAPVGAFFLAGFTLIANVIFHNFWAYRGADCKKEFLQFITYVAIIGGLLVVMAR